MGLRPEAFAGDAAWWPLVSGGVAFLCAVALTPLVMRWAHRKNWLAYPRKDRWHKRPTALMGGLAIGAALVTALLVSSAVVRLPGFIWAGGVLVFAIGTFDDLWEMEPGAKLLAQVVAAGFVLLAGHVFWQSGPVWLTVPLTMLWVIGVTNAFNLIDGMDGLAAGIAAIAALALAASAWMIGQVALLCIALAIAGAASGFLVYNFAPARIFMGDGGSMTLGYALSVLALAVQAEVAIKVNPSALLVPVIVLALPIFDVVLVTVTRVWNGHSIAQGGNDHTMHRLAFLGLSERRTVLMLYGVSALLGALALTSFAAERQFFYALALLSVVAFAVFGSYIGQAGVYEEGEGDGSRTATQKLGAVLQVLIGRYWKTPVGIVGDLMLVTASFVLAHVLRFEEGIGPSHAVQMMQVLPGIIGVKVLMFYKGGLYWGIWRHAGTPELVRICWVSLGASIVVFIGAGFAYGFEELSRTVFLLDWILTMNVVAMARFGFRGLRQYLSAQREGGRRVLLYGDDHTSMLLLRYLRRRRELSMTPVGLLYDNSDQRGFTVQGLSVVGTPDNLSEICAAYDVEGVVIASPPVDTARRISFTRLCEDFGLSCYYIDLTVHSSQLLPEVARLKGDTEHLADALSYKDLELTP